MLIFDGRSYLYHLVSTSAVDIVHTLHWRLLLFYVQICSHLSILLVQVHLYMQTRNLFTCSHSFQLMSCTICVVCHSFHRIVQPHVHFNRNFIHERAFDVPVESGAITIASGGWSSVLAFWTSGLFTVTTAYDLEHSSVIESVWDSFSDWHGDSVCICTSVWHGNSVCICTSDWHGDSVCICTSDWLQACGSSSPLSSIGPRSIALLNETSGSSLELYSVKERTLIALQVLNEIIQPRVDCELASLVIRWRK